MKRRTGKAVAVEGIDIRMAKQVNRQIVGEVVKHVTQKSVSQPSRTELALMFSLSVKDEDSKADRRRIEQSCRSRRNYKCYKNDKKQST